MHPVASRSSRWSFCARWAGLGLLVALGACAPSQGWQHTDRRACDPQSAPIVCLAAEPEGPYELVIGDRVVLPGECVQGPVGEGGGRLRTVSKSSGGEVARPRVGARKGTHTEVRIDGKRLRVVQRRRCDGRIDSDPPES